MNHLVGFGHTRTPNTRTPNTRTPSTHPLGRRMRRWLPPQHGAWAMLLLPYLIGVARVRPAWIHLPLLAAWLAGYLLSYHAQLAIKIRTVSRVRPQLLGYGLVTAMAGAVVLALRPMLAVAGLAFVPLLAINAWYARRRRDRSLLNGLASVVQGVLMVFVAVAAAGGSPGRVVGDAVTLLLAFTGSLLYVKTMIRERGQRSYLVASIGFHAAALVPAVLLAPALGVPFGWFLLRAVLLPHHRPTVKQVGLLELAGFLVLAGALLLGR